ncbi:hypothetical protein PHLGIDRAFT_141321 [Phlebiopsis gigantea 11061_1 CR5-6]|uniref:Uncharacterized protein n=1 Tax=Phlebiopsis gigantea (strain 11061_1 CR5-6) TaxID=745531 RepID=A0A0C3PUH2_PHLG1|nr:hypothetical protein PHLGIDRAFT_141321 [Phlebiopsis gigantea 11061_1 CR5-6]
MPFHNTTCTLLNFVDSPLSLSESCAPGDVAALLISLFKHPDFRAVAFDDNNDWQNASFMRDGGRKHQRAWRACSTKIHEMQVPVEGMYRGGG